MLKNAKPKTKKTDDSKPKKRAKASAENVIATTITAEKSPEVVAVKKVAKKPATKQVAAESLAKKSVAKKPATKKTAAKKVGAKKPIKKVAPKTPRVRKVRATPVHEDPAKRELQDAARVLKTKGTSKRDRKRAAGLMGAIGGSIGGQNRAKNLTPEERKEIARKGGLARQKKAREERELLGI